VDTRRLTKLVRTGGAVRCVVSTVDHDPDSLLAKARGAALTDGRDLASEVSCKEPYAWSEGYAESYPALFEGQRGETVPLVVYDFGTKRNVLRSLVHVGFDLTVVPAWTPADEVLAMQPAGVLLSNGPGDPAAVRRGIEAVSGLVGELPVLGICLGHQILSIVLGARTHKMLFGHHGANHPVRDLATGKVEITSQNHSFAVDPTTLPDALELTHLNLNDETVEGIRHRSLPLYSIQYHPEAAPGPLDSAHLFRRFRELVRG
jgi:carbamoyl-phosphate synthase small subunit